jgi:hypothetical protein
MGDTFRKDWHMIGEGVVPLPATDTGMDLVATLTGAAVASYVGNVSGAVGVLQLAMVATSEIESACVSFGDVLALDALMLKYVEFRARMAVALGTTATTMVAFGLASERNDAIDSIAEAALFRILGDGSDAVVVESDDGTTNNDDVATGETLTTTFKRFGIDFQHGLSDVRFFMDDSNGRLARVASGTTFDLSALTTGEGLQFYAQIQKAANTELGTLQIDRFTVDFKEP